MLCSKVCISCRAWRSPQLCRSPCPALRPAWLPMYDRQYRGRFWSREVAFSAVMSTLVEEKESDMHAFCHAGVGQASQLECLNALRTTGRGTTSGRPDTYHSSCKQRLCLLRSFCGAVAGSCSSPCMWSLVTHGQRGTQRSLGQAPSPPRGAGQICTPQKSLSQQYSPSPRACHAASQGLLHRAATSLLPRPSGFFTPKQHHSPPAPKVIIKAPMES